MRAYFAVLVLGVALSANGAYYAHITNNSGCFMTGAIGWNYSPTTGGGNSFSMEPWAATTISIDTSAVAVQCLTYTPVSAGSGLSPWSSAVGDVYYVIGCGGISNAPPTNNIWNFSGYITNGSPYAREYGIYLDGSSTPAGTFWVAPGDVHQLTLNGLTTGDVSVRPTTAIYPNNEGVEAYLPGGTNAGWSWGGVVTNSTGASTGIPPLPLLPGTNIVFPASGTDPILVTGFNAVKQGLNDLAALTAAVLAKSNASIVNVTVTNTGGGTNGVEVTVNVTNINSFTNDWAGYSNTVMGMGLAASNGIIGGATTNLTAISNLAASASAASTGAIDGFKTNLAGAVPTIPGGSDSGFIIVVRGHTFNLNPLSNVDIAAVAASVKTLLAWLITIAFIFACVTAMEPFLIGQTSAQQARSSGQSVFGWNAALPLSVAMAVVITAAVALLPIVGLAAVSSTLLPDLTANAEGWNTTGAMSRAWYLLNAFVNVPLLAAQGFFYMAWRVGLASIYTLATTIIRFAVGCLIFGAGMASADAMEFNFTNVTDASVTVNGSMFAGGTFNVESMGVHSETIADAVGGLTFYFYYDPDPGSYDGGHTFDLPTGPFPGAVYGYYLEFWSGANTYFPGTEVPPDPEPSAEYEIFGAGFATMLMVGGWGLMMKMFNGLRARAEGGL